MYGHVVCVPVAVQLCALGQVCALVLVNSWRPRWGVGCLPSAITLSPVLLRQGIFLHFELGLFSQEEQRFLNTKSKPDQMQFCTCMKSATSLMFSVKLFQVLRKS